MAGTELVGRATYGPAATRSDRHTRSASKAAPAAPLARRQRQPPTLGPRADARRGRTLAASADQDRSHDTHANTAQGRLPRHPLSSSRPPRLGRPAGVASRWLRQPRPGNHSQGFGACEEGRGKPVVGPGQASDTGDRKRPEACAASPGGSTHEATSESDNSQHQTRDDQGGSARISRCTIVSAMSAESRPGRYAVAARAMTRTRR